MREKYLNKFIFAISLALIVSIGNFTFKIFNIKSCSTNIQNEIYDGKTIILDIGHGGFDGGAVSNDGTEEKNINLEIGLKLKDLLTSCGYNVICTRIDDTINLPENAKTIREKKVADMENRLNLLKSNPQALFISIHQNKFPDKNIKGAQIFYNDKKQQSQILAVSIQKSIQEYADPQNNRKAKSSGDEYYLLEQSPNCGVIIECGFISNDEELAKLKSESYQNTLVYAISKGIENFFSNDFEKNPV